MSTPRSDAELHRWREVRAVVFERDEGRCRECGALCPAGEADVHHLIPRATGGRDEPENLIVLCDACHALRHPNLHASLARRALERWGLRFAKWLDRRGELSRVDDSLGATLRVLGVTHFRPVQLEVVLAALRGESLLLVAATGSGKSLCFQVPILIRPGCGFVLSPLKALMSQQVTELQRRQIPATFINGDLGPAEKALRYALLRKHAVKFLFCTPERFDATMVRQAEVDEISNARPSYLVVDEAHCIDRWGKDFRPNYGRLREVRRALGDPPLIALTATAGVESQQRILQSLGIPGARVVVTGVDRPNIAFARIADVNEAKRYDVIAALLRRMPVGRAMLFVPTVNIGDKLQRGLRARSLHVPFYHSRAGTASERDVLLGRFLGRLEPAQRVVICTNAFGMGLDVADVRLVVHWQCPASVEDYLQEFGRAGRDGAPSIAVLFTSENDPGLLRFMADRTIETAELDARERDAVGRAKYRAIVQMHERARDRRVCFRAAITEYFGEAPRSARRSLALRILEWLFSRDRRVERTDGCCDRCDGVGDHNVVDWAGRIWGVEDAERSWWRQLWRRHRATSLSTPPATP